MSVGWFGGLLFNARACLRFPLTFVITLFLCDLRVQLHFRAIRRMCRNGPQKGNAARYRQIGCWRFKEPLLFGVCVVSWTRSLDVRGDVIMRCTADFRIRNDFGLCITGHFVVWRVTCANGANSRLTKTGLSFFLSA